MRACLVIGSFLSAILSLQISPVWSDESEESVDLYMGGWASRSLKTYAGHESETLRERTANFRMGPYSYGISYKAGYDENRPGRAFPLEGYIGMPQPTSCNWYHSGFLSISLDGKDIGSAPLSSIVISERGKRGILDMVWHHELGSVRVRFLGLPGQDHLLCEIAIDPVAEIRDIDVRLRCYPSFFTSHHKRVGARRIQTPSSLILEGERKTLPSGDNWYGLYYDEVFDVAKGEGEGPCAMLVSPDEAAEILFAPGGYAVETAVKYPGATRRIHLAFWDFKGMTNADALATLQKNADSTLTDFAAVDFTPAPVSGFDIARARQDVQAAMQSQTAASVLGDRIAELKTWLDECAPAIEGSQARGNIKAEEQLLQSIDRYNDFVWEIKLAEALAEI